ncbi:MAG TPA: DNA repair protein RecN, partial [Candidatus Polarisedimenticolia bacterium]|nr:DNA repair protein RecN [Candidatus Polarisedimenticolia bacterium]
SREESLLRNAEEVGRLAAQAHALVSEDDDSAIARLAAARERLERLSAIDPEAAQIRDQIEEARLTAAEAARGIAGYADAETFNPGRLERVAGRLADLDRLKRRYGATLQEVLAYREQAAGELSLLDRAADRLATIDAELEESESAYRRSAASLSDRRRQAAAVLEKGLRRELGDLAMEGTRVAIAVEAADPAERAAHGADRVEFLIAPNKGEPLRPLARIASGGELSRLMLALRNAAEARGDRRVLIFDEIDSGIGGRTAEVVGQRLAALASSQQVLCVTHLPQIAAFADRHFRVMKQEAAGRTQAMVAPLDREGRIDELARMLGGSPPQSARRHAAALVRQVGPGGPGKPSSPARGTRAQR